MRPSFMTRGSAGNIWPVDLWPGIALDLILPFAVRWTNIVPTRTVPPHGGFFRAALARVRQVGGVMFVIYIAAATVLWPWHRHWGTTSEERAMSLPGDPCAFVLREDARGGTRLLVRSTISNPRIPVWAAALSFTAFELPHFIMERRMLLGIKERAERARSQA